jgi:hypothetical protein
MSSLQVCNIAEWPPVEEKGGHRALQATLHRLYGRLNCKLNHV